METNGGGTAEGKKKRWGTLEKLKETWKELASYHAALSLPSSTVTSLRSWAPREDANMPYVKNDDGDMAVGKIEKLGLIDLNKPAYCGILPARFASDQSWRAQLALPGALFQMHLAGGAAWPASGLPGSQRPILNSTPDAATSPANRLQGSQAHKTLVSYKWDSSTVISNLRELQKQHGFSLGSHINFNKDSFGSPVAEHMSSSDSWSDNSGMDEPSSGSEDIDKPDIPAEEDMPYQLFIGPYTQEEAEFIRQQERDQDGPNLYLLEEGLTWQQKVLTILHMARVREFTEYDPKQYSSVPYRFCEFNIAFFDLNKESKVEHGPLLYRHHSELDFRQLDHSVNVISIKVVESDVPYPINIYGTVLARDQYDYRCVYLFKRGRDESQLICSPDDTLTLTGPYRALAGLSSMFFEFHLKIKGEDTVDQDFSKGLLERNPCRDTRKPRTLPLESYLSTVDVVCMPVPFALEASIEVNILDRNFNFMGKIAAWTQQTEESKIILYDSEVAGTETKLGNDGAVCLTRHVVAVPQDECLVIHVSVYDGNYGSKCENFVLQHSAEVFNCKVGPYELKFTIIWKEVRKRHPELCKHIDDISVLWE